MCACSVATRSSGCGSRRSSLSLGDWLGFLAITILAASLGSGSGGAAVGLVMSARIIPGFFFSPVAGVLVDRWDRKKIMVTCDLIRAGMICTLPFVHSVLGLVLVSLVLEVCTLLWSPAKEASVPEPRSDRPPDDCELAVARGGVRHVPDRRRALRVARASIPVARHRRHPELPQDRSDGARVLCRRNHVRHCRHS